jgi:hypothetical protein
MCRPRCFSQPPIGTVGLRISARQQYGVMSTSTARSTDEEHAVGRDERTFMKLVVDGKTTACSDAMIGLMPLRSSGPRDRSMRALGACSPDRRGFPSAAEEFVTMR